ncbi:CheR family methyltransferase [Inmirania thermothiophila]|uniref:protein-glutamate O-methyltransferase n=1 Tax=Inmirania thermothiophila TaxID=1750597 RepID=A0A3N1Y5F9_9GAMM|nr:protein-glutamate O-methyltransferase CheR [Inmirania thermothiophila]ROR32517.1 chemotaxis protein methyltransferase CheR [Inmirania thermothiophila]
MAPISEADLRLVRALVAEDAGIELDEGRSHLVEAGLWDVARERGLDGPEAVLARLRTGRDPGLRRRVVEAMTIHESSFFRDGHPFEALRDVVLPALVRARRAERRLRIWSAAAAAGQEAYSVAMLLVDHFPQVAQWDVEILGTDIARDQVERARTGVFGEHELRRGVPEALRRRHFEAVEGGWRASARLRRLVRFEVVNLAGAWPRLPRMDLVLLRNVLIYFPLDLRERVLERTRRVMADDGWLLLGATETTIRLGARFERVVVGATAFYRPALESSGVGQV